MTGEELFLCYLGDISNREGGQQLAPTDVFNHVEKTYFKFVEGAIEFCRKNPQKQLVILYRAHPRDPLGPEEMSEITSRFCNSGNLPSNLKLLSACQDKIRNIREIRAVSDGIFGITATESKQAHLNGRQGVLLVYPELSGKVHKHLYQNRTFAEITAACNVLFVESQLDLCSILGNLSKAPEAGVGSQREGCVDKILTEVFRN